MKLSYGLASFGFVFAALTSNARSLHADTNTLGWIYAGATLQPSSQHMTTTRELSRCLTGLIFAYNSYTENFKRQSLYFSSPMRCYYVPPIADANADIENAPVRLHAQFGFEDRNTGFQLLYTSDGFYTQIPVANTSKVIHVEFSREANQLTVHWLQDNPSTRDIGIIAIVPRYDGTERTETYDLGTRSLEEFLKATDGLSKSSNGKLTSTEITAIQSIWGWVKKAPKIMPVVG